MDYGQLLTNAWRIVWSNKFLLILGFLAALGSAGSSSNSNFSYTVSGDELPPGFAENIELFLAGFAPILMGLICLGFVLVIVFWLVRLTAQGGLISAAARLEINGVVRCDTIENLPEDFNGFWISGPGNIVHLVHGPQQEN